MDDWKRVIWSDETKINRFCSDGRSWCWIRDGEGVQNRHVQQTVKHGGGSILVWGCMTYHGSGYLSDVDGRVDQNLYRTILEGELTQTVEYYGLNASQVNFQHDNDPKHTARSVTEWLGERAFSVLEWPAQYRDLNTIEHLWANLKRHLNKYDTPPRRMLELWDHVQTEWNKLDTDTCVHLIESIDIDVFRR